MQNISNFNEKLISLVSYGVCLFVVSYYLHPLDSSPKASFYLFVAFPLLLYAVYNIRRFDLQAVLKVDACFYLKVGMFLIILFIWFSYLWGTPGNFQPFMSQSKRTAEMFTLLFAICIMVYNRASLIKPLFTAMFIAAVVHACMLIFEYLPAYRSMEHFRITNPIDTGIVYGVALVIGMWRFLSEELKVSILYLLGCLPLLVILVMTKSRGPQLALMLTVLPMIFIHKDQWQRILTVALAATVSILALAIWTDIFQTVFSRGFGLTYRDEIWVRSIQQFLEYPMFGSGASMDMPIPISDGFIHSHSHNLLLDMLRVTGVVGFILVAGHNGYAFWRGFVSQNRGIMLWSIIFLFGFLCLMSSGGIPFSRPSHSWIAYWIPLGFICFMLPANDK